MITLQTLNDVIKKGHFNHAVQPIFDLNSWMTLGSEVLLRSENCSPAELFNYARRTDKLFDLDTQSIRKAITTLHHKLQDHFLFINICPSTIMNSSFPSFIEKVLSEVGFVHQQIVLEINEMERVADLSSFKERVEMIKAHGFLIAIDDLGKGWSSLSQMIELQPKFAKLDRYFATDLAVSEGKQEMIKSLLNYCQSNDISLVLEGIEYQQDLAMAKALGIKIGQGFLLGKPQQPQ